MRVRRVILRVLLWTTLAVIVAGGVMYVLASVKPQRYAPQHLSPDQQAAAMEAFFAHTAYEDSFLDKIGRTPAGESFTWTITAEQANSYLASMDAIASFAKRKPVHALARMERVGLVGPAVAMDDGVLTLMGKIRDYNKVISIDLAFDIDDAGEIAIEIHEIRVGVLPIPRRLVDEALAEARLELAEQLAKAQRGEPAVMGAVNMNDLAGLMKRIITMLDGRRVPAEITVKAGARHRTIIQQIEIDDGKLTLTCGTPGE